MTTSRITFKSTGQSVVRLSKEEKKRLEQEKEATARKQKKPRNQAAQTGRETD